MAYGIYVSTMLHTLKNEMLTPPADGHGILRKQLVNMHKFEIFIATLVYLCGCYVLSLVYVRRRSGLFFMSVGDA